MMKCNCYQEACEFSLGAALAGTVVGLVLVVGTVFFAIWLAKELFYNDKK